MGRVITGRGDVFNYKRGDLSRGKVEFKPYDYGKLMTNIHRGAIITEKAMKSPLGAGGSPLITAPKAAYGALKAGGKWAAEKLDLRAPDPISEAARVKALAEGKVQPKPPGAPQVVDKAPAAAPVPGPQGGVQVKQPPLSAPSVIARPTPTVEERIAGLKAAPASPPPILRPDGAKSQVDGQLIQMQWTEQSSHPLVVNLRNAQNTFNKLEDLQKSTPADTEQNIARKNDLNAKLVDAQSAYQQAAEAARIAGLDVGRFLGTSGPSVHAPAAPPAAPAAPPAARPAPPATVAEAFAPKPAAQPAAAPAGLPAGGLAAIGPETAALAGGLDKQRDTAFALQQEAYRQLGGARDRGTAQERAQAAGLKGMALLQNRPFNAAFRQMADELGMDAQALANSMWAESEVDPKNVNPRSGATGLIQFTRPTAAELKTTPEAIGALNPIDQLNVVKDYFLLRKEQFPALDYSNPDHIDLAIFAPAKAGKSLDTTLYSATGSHPDRYTQNIEIDQFGPEGRPGRNDGKITVQERLTWMQDAAKKKGGPIPTLAPPRDMPPAPTRQHVTAQDLVGQRKQVDSGALVVPGVKPSTLSLGNMMIMARNSKDDAQKNWVRQLAQDDDAEIPWTSLGDLFTGAYKQRAAKAIEAAFPKVPDELKRAKTDYYKAAATKALRVPAAKKDSRRGRISKLPDRWRRPMTQLENGINRRTKRRAALQKYLDGIITGEGKVHSREFGPPKQDQMESKTAFNARVEAWNTAKKIADDWRGKRPDIVKAIRKKISDLGYEISEYERVIQDGAAYSSEERFTYGPPKVWSKDFLDTTRGNRDNLGQGIYIPPAPKGFQSKAKANAKTPTTPVPDQPLIIGDPG
jgi:hypothetical protein